MTEKESSMLVTSKELWREQAPCFNFTLDEEQLLKKALSVGYVTKVGDDLYEVNKEYYNDCDKEYFND
tara:strand:- start:912 stop:1115 length:204 start_codon:yes stop_codon:yes gene_type:complete